MRDLPTYGVRWSLSGPQFPRPTAIQQRYCYPTTEIEYSKTKGGALWTMFGADGKEDATYRVLHVYYSTKRAGNPGGKRSKRGTTQASGGPYSPPAPKRTKRVKRSGTRLTTPRRGIRNCLPIHHIVSPAVTASTASSKAENNSICASPGSIDTVLTNKYHFGTNPTSTDRAIDQALADTPMPPLEAHKSFTVGGFASRSPFPVQVRQASSLSYPAFTRPGSLPPYGRPNQGLGGPAISKDSSMDIDMSLLDDDDFFNDPVMNLALTASDDNLDFPPHGQLAAGSATGCASSITKANVDTFSTHLDSLHNRVRDMICDAPSGDRGSMVSTFASWARSVASTPMDEPNVASVFRRSGGDKKTPTVLATKKAKSSEISKKE